MIMENRDYYNDLFISLCEKNDLYKIQFVLELKEEIRPDINYNKGEGLVISCIHDYYDLFKFLIEHNNNHFTDMERLFTICCDFGSLKCAKYLLDNNDISKEAFKKSVYHLLIDIVDNERKEAILEYFLFDNKFSKEGNLKIFLEKSFPDIDVSKIFSVIEKKYLEKTLEVKNIDKIKMTKI